jgi:hypothetical protein
MTNSSSPRRFSLNEDWLATIIGLILVAVVGFGLLGPGAQSVRLQADAGESAPAAYLLPIAGWKASATLDGEKLAIPADTPTALARESVTAFVCTDGQLALDPDLAATISARPEGGKATLLLINNCDSKVILTYATDPLIRWPLFGLFAR